jgi:RNA polymerase sigma factor for flagellar operon FliA
MADRDQLEAYIPFVRRVAAKVRRRLEPPLEIDELVSYGMVGLSEALDRYRPDTGVPFESFAHYRVRGAVLEGISKHCPISRHVHRRLKLEERANDYMEGVSRDLGGAADRTASSDGAMLASTVRDLATIYSVSQRTRFEERRTDFVDPDDRDHPHVAAEHREVLGFLDELPREQRELIELYYFEDLTLDEVGQRLGFKKSWACKMHKAALRRLREMMSGEPEDPAGR